MIDCERFQQRFQHCLDAGQSLDSDLLLHQHAQQCPDCREDLRAWRQISRMIEPPAGARGRAPLRWAAAAAAVLAGMVWYSVPGQGDSVAEQAERPSAAKPVATWATAAESLAGREWLDQWSEAVAEPLVPISDGVRPLARGVRSALGLLIVPGDPAAPAIDSAPSPAQAGVPCDSLHDAYV